MVSRCERTKGTWGRGVKDVGRGVKGIEVVGQFRPLPNNTGTCATLVGTEVGTTWCSTRIPHTPQPSSPSPELFRTA
jgi:hypothetical protein